MRIRPIVTGLLLSLALAPPALAKTAAFGIVVGNNAPPIASTTEQLDPLRYADDDAARYDILFRTFSREVWLLSVFDSDTQRRHQVSAGRARVPSRAELERVVETASRSVAKAKQRGERTVLYFAFSGHGARSRDGTPFLALHDGPLTQKGFFEHVVRSVGADITHVFIDACYADSFITSRELFEHEKQARIRQLSAQELHHFFKQPLSRRFPSVGALVATSNQHRTHEWSRIQGGVFTHELLSGLRGAADVNRDGVIEYSEIHAFIAAANRDMNDTRARPRIIAVAPSVNRREPIVRLDDMQGLRRLTGDFGRLGHFHLELADGTRYLDAHLERGFPATLALPRGQRVYVKTREREAAIEAEDRTKLVKLAQLAFIERSTRQRGAIADALSQRLFATPFGPSYYRGHVDSAGAHGVALASADQGPPRTNGMTAVQTRQSAERPLHRFALLGGGLFSDGMRAMAGGILVAFEYSVGGAHRFFTQSRFGWLPSLQSEGGPQSDVLQFGIPVGYRYLLVDTERYSGGVHVAATSSLSTVMFERFAGSVMAEVGGTFGYKHFTAQGNVGLGVGIEGLYRTFSGSFLVGYAF